jgi:hypothetical protein
MHLKMHQVRRPFERPDQRLRVRVRPGEAVEQKKINR